MPVLFVYVDYDDWKGDNVWIWIEFLYLYCVTD